MLNFYIFILFVGMVLGLLFAVGGRDKYEHYIGFGLFSLTSVLLFVIQFL